MKIKILMLFLFVIIIAHAQSTIDEKVNYYLCDNIWETDSCSTSPIILYSLVHTENSLKTSYYWINNFNLTDKKIWKHFRYYLALKGVITGEETKTTLHEYDSTTFAITFDIETDDLDKTLDIIRKFSEGDGFGGKH